MTSYNLAVALGSSRVAAASAHTDPDLGVVAEPISLGRLGTASSCLFVPRDGDLVFGDAARQHGQAQPERMICDLRHRLGDDVPLLVGGQRLVPEQLYAQLIAWVVQRATEQAGEPPAGITIGYPATEWGTHRLSLIATALAALGLDGFDFIPESEAAVAQYEASAPLENGQTVAVYDLGGDALSCAVLRKERDGGLGQVGASGGLTELGGTDFDDLVFRHVMEVSGLAKMTLDADHVDVRGALIRLREACVEAKETLSSQTAVTIPVAVAAVHTTVRLTRAEFEQMIEPALDRTIDVLDDTVEHAGIQVSQLEAVLLIGGSSRIPRVAQRLSESLDRPIVIDSDPALSAVLGAARAGLRFAEARAQAVIGAHEQQAAVVEDLPTPDDESAAQPAVRSKRRRCDRGRLMVFTAAVVTVVTLLLSGSSSGSPLPAGSAVDEASTSHTSWSQAQRPSPADGEPSADLVEPTELRPHGHLTLPGEVSAVPTSNPVGSPGAPTTVAPNTTAAADDETVADLAPEIGTQLPTGDTTTDSPVEPTTASPPSDSSAPSAPETDGS